MIGKRYIKLIAKKFDKKIGDKAINKISKILKDYIENILKGASMEADYDGRNIIQEKDIVQPRR